MNKMTEFTRLLLQIGSLPKISVPFGSSTLSSHENPHCPMHLTHPYTSLHHASHLMDGNKMQ
jgi:hypothetical protein